MAEEDFGGLLRTYRRERKMTQAALAGRGGVALRTLTYWETGKHTPGAQELDSIAGALALTPEERQTLLVSLPRGKAGRLIHALPEWNDLAPPPGVGDLIRALRWRKRLSREQAAAVLGVHRATLTRWETALSIPGEETRLRLCDLLGAMPEERALLLNLAPVAPRWDGEMPTLDACREEAARLERGSGREADPLFDLSAYLLTGTLWNLAARHAEARSILARAYAARAVYACVHGDDSAALDYSGRALDLLWKEHAPPKGALYRALWASGNALAHRAPLSGAEQNLRQMKQWLLKIGTSKAPAFLFLNAAYWALNSDSLREAQEYWGAANRRVDRNANLSPYFLEGLQRFHANLLVREERYDAALEAALHAPRKSYYHPIMRLLFQTSVFLKTGARSDADSHLRRAYELITADQADFYRREADGLADQLERNA